MQIYKITSHTLTVETGVKNTVFSVAYVRNALVLRAREFRSFVYDLAFISANKDFTTGGYFDAEDRVVVFDKVDLSVDIEPGDFIVVNDVRYLINEVLDFEPNSIQAAACRRVRGAPLLRVESVKSNLTITHEAEYVDTSSDILEASSVLYLTQRLIEKSPVIANETSDVINLSQSLTGRLAATIMLGSSSVLNLSQTSVSSYIPYSGPPRDGFGPLR